MGNCCFKYKRLPSRFDTEDDQGFCMSPITQAALTPASPEKGGSLHFSSESPPTYSAQETGCFMPKRRRKPSFPPPLASSSSSLHQPLLPQPESPLKLVAEKKGKKQTFYFDELCECIVCERTQNEKAHAPVFITADKKLVFHPKCFGERYEVKNCIECVSPFELIPVRGATKNYYICAKCMTMKLGT